TRLGWHLAAFRTVEDPPYQEVITAVFKPVFGRGGNEQEIACFELVPLAVVKQNASPANDDVNFVLLVRRLYIRARRRPENHIERAALQNADGSLARVRDGRLSLRNADHMATSGLAHAFHLVPPNH